MASQTLAEAGKLVNNEIVSGVIEDIISLNPVYAYLPFDGYDGQAIVVNRESTLGDAGLYSVGDTITNKAAAAFAQVTFSATKLIGDVEMDGLVQATSMGGGVDQIANEVSSKAKSVGRLFQTGMATGTGTLPSMNSVRSMVDSSQATTGATADGDALSFELLDQLIDLVTAKDGQVDWLMMPARTMRSYRTLLRALGGTPGDWVANTPDGRTVLTYEGIPIFRNDYLDVAETKGATSTCTSIYAGCFDSGDRKTGIAGIHPSMVPAGVQIEMVGRSETKDEEIIRVKQYANLALFSKRALARLSGITN